MKAVNVVATKVKWVNKDGNISEKTLARKVKLSSITTIKRQKEQRDGGRETASEIHFSRFVDFLHSSQVGISFCHIFLLPVISWHVILIYFMSCKVMLCGPILIYPTILYYTILYYTILSYTILYYIISYYTILYYSIW